MRLVNLNEVTPEMKLARPIYHQDKILLNTDCTNLYKYRTRLIDFGITYVYVEDELSEGISIQDVIKEETREGSKKILREVLKDSTFNPVIGKKVQKVITDMVDEILFYDDIVVNLIDIKSHDSYTYAHSVNVAVLALIMGKALHYTRERLIKLGIGALLHDVGKRLIPVEVLNKPGKLTEKEFQQIKEHARLGYENLKDQGFISPLSKTVVLSHHERIDGTGYPKGLKGRQIHDFARIVAIADVFDSLNSDRIYRKRWPTHRILDYILANVDSQFDRCYVKKFFRHMAIYPNGTMVTLSTGQKAVVKEQNKNYPTKPIVKIFEENNGIKMVKTVDLLETLNIVITDADQ